MDVKQQLQDLERRTLRFRSVVATLRPGTPEPIVVAVGAAVRTRAEQLSAESRLRFFDVAEFLFDRAENWLLEGTPIDEIADRLLTDLESLGFAKIAASAQSRYML